MSVEIARCPEHGLHGERSECFVCGGPVEQVEMVPVVDLLSDEAINALAVRVWDDPLDALLDTDKESLRAAIREAVAAASAARESGEHRG